MAVCWARERLITSSPAFLNDLCLVTLCLPDPPLPTRLCWEISLEARGESTPPEELLERRVEEVLAGPPYSSSRVFTDVTLKHREKREVRVSPGCRVKILR